MSNLKNPPNKDLINEVAIIKQIDPTYIEKDWYVTQALDGIAQLKYEDFEIIFSGGTALSKAHSLINRFSEDLDFRVQHPNITGSREQYSKLKNTIKSHLEERGFYIPKEPVARNGNKFFSLEIEYASQFP